LGVEDSGGQSGELVDLMGTEMREEPPLQRRDVVVLSLLELLDPLAGNRDVDTATVVPGGRPGDQSPRLEFGHEPRHPTLAERPPFHQVHHAKAAVWREDGEEEEYLERPQSDPVLALQIGVELTGEGLARSY
jgi:hypothetical protein